MLASIVCRLNLIASWAWRCVAEESGASIAEYGLVLSLIALIAFGALALIGGATTNLLAHSAHAVAGP